MAEAVSEGLTGERPTDGANGFLMYSILRLSDRYLSVFVFKRRAKVEHNSYFLNVISSPRGLIWENVLDYYGAALDRCYF